MGPKSHLAKILALAVAPVAAAAVWAPGAAWAQSRAAAAPTALPPPPPPPSPGVLHPFRLGLSYNRVLAEDGVLANDGVGTNAVGLDFAFPSRDYARNHLGLAHQWESAGSGAGAYTARGFRVDLISVGFPIALNSAPVRVHLEPLVTVLRGEIMFVSGSDEKILRVESGVSLLATVMYQQWFFGIEPLAIDFRYYVARSIGPSRAGFSRVFPFRVMIGREF